MTVFSQARQRPNCGLLGARTIRPSGPLSSRINRALTNKGPRTVSGGGDARRGRAWLLPMHPAGSHQAWPASSRRTRQWPGLFGPVPPERSDLWPHLFSDVNCIALWINSEKILTRLYSILHWFHKRLEVNVKNPWENRCFQTVIVCSFGSVDNAHKCTLLWKIAGRLITVSTSVNNEMWVKLRRQRGDDVMLDA